MDHPPRLKRIIHVDMDAFFAAVEVLDNPGLKGRPVIVGGLGNRGVVSTASYEARAYGVHSALPMSTARRLCPQGVFLVSRSWRYQEVSSHIMAIFGRYTPLVEPLSLDEAFLDVTASGRLFGPPEKIARRLKVEIKEETGLTATAGVATQKHLAKIASGLNKPDGLTVVPEGGELEFLWPLPLNKLWGVGQVMLGRLANLGLVTVGDLAKLEYEFLEKRFGRSGGQLWRLANGLDEREVVTGHEAKSVGAEETFAVDLIGPEAIKKALLAQTLTAVNRLRRKALKARTITVKFRNHQFETITRAKSLPQPTDQRNSLYQTVLTIYEKEAASLGPMRLLGVSFSGLIGRDEKPTVPAPTQRSLFEQGGETPPTDPKKSDQINQALDLLNQRFGDNVVKPATLVGNKSPAPPTDQSSDI